VGPGTGTPVLLLHGQPGSARDWDGVLAALPPGASTLAFDRPGWDGRSAAGGLEVNGRAALSMLDGTGSERAVVVGHSFGGAVAAWLAVHAPERVAGLVLCAPAANVASLYAIDRWLAIPLAGDVASAALLGLAGLALSAGPLRGRLAAELKLGDRFLLGAGQRLVRPATWRAFAVEQRAMISELPELERGLGQITAPTRIVAGSQDRIVPLSSLRQLSRQIPGAELVLLDGAGHLLPLHRARDLATVIWGLAAGRQAPA
jgi:pimeloyl-ACP methyl ester carboxylesterase